MQIKFWNFNFNRLVGLFVSEQLLLSGEGSLQTTRSPLLYLIQFRLFVL